MISGTLSKIDRSRVARILRIIAKVIGIIVAVFFLMMLIGDAEMAITSETFSGITSEWLFILIPVVIALAAFGIAWRWEFLGGILLIPAYLILSFSPAIHSIFYNPEFRIAGGMFLFALPFLVAGVLFIAAAWLSRENY
jgi:hypothetical protein